MKMAIRKSKMKKKKSLRKLKKRSNVSRTIQLVTIDSVSSCLTLFQLMQDKTFVMEMDSVSEREQPDLTFGPPVFYWLYISLTVLDSTMLYVSSPSLISS